MANTLSYRAGRFADPNLPWECIAAAGVQGLELIWDADLSAAAVAAALSPHDLRVTSLQVGGALDDDDPPARFGAAAAVAAELGATYIFTSAKRGDMPLAEAAKRLRRVGDATGAHHVAVALETHPDLCTNAQRMAETMAAVDHPWVGVNYDTANVFYYNHDVDTVAQLSQCLPLVRGVHYKDSHGGYEDFDFPVFGEGVVPFDRIAQVLRDGGYDGACCMELEGPAFKREDPDDLADKVARCVAHLKSVGAA